MHKTIMIILLLFLTVNAKDLTPIATIKTSGLVTDFVEDHGYLYVATDAGIVDIIDLTTQKIVKKIIFEPLRTAMGDFVPARVHSIDRYHGKTLLVTSGSNAYRNVWIHDGKHLKKIIDEKQHMMPKCVLFTDKGKIVFGTFGSDVVLYDYKENYTLYDSHISESTMGGMALSQDKKKMVISDESGTVRLIDVNSSKVEKVFSSEHIDNIYRVAYSNGVIITAGQDRRVGVYSENGKAYHIKSDFLVYSVGISPSGETGIYSSGIDHDLQLFHTKDGSKTDRLIGHYATPNKIMFINENALISAGDENRVFFWMIEK
ncbi:MAG: nitrate reductase [Epsilonproteobacteria bacterium (ex Lamellibrachia satsuma)]|nr:MAG: nitrate reductase [Epsilonproteobacteria bacterium (ex Lamellibrachia satsuma)]